MNTMSEDQVVTELRRAAEHAVPELSLDPTEVRSAGRRGLVRHRLAASGAGALAVAVLAVGVTYAPAWRADTTPPAASAPPTASATVSPAPTPEDPSTVEGPPTRAAVAVAGAIESLVDPLESGRVDDPDLAGYLLVSVAGNAADLYWKGVLPQQISDIIDAHPNVDVRVHEAAYSANEFLAAQDAMVERLQATLPAGTHLDSMQHVGNREGFTVFVLDPELTLDPAPIADQLRDLLPPTATIEVVVSETGSVPLVEALTNG